MKTNATLKALAPEIDTREAIYSAMVKLVYSKGYNGAPLRSVAELVGIRMASLYHHFESKQELLVEIMRRTMHDLTEAVISAVESCSPEDPEARLRAAIFSHVSFHAERREEAFVTDSELRALESDNRRWIGGLRRRYEGIFSTIMREGRAKGLFSEVDERLALNALLGMCSQVAIWYRPGGRLTIGEVAQGYSDIFLDGIKSGSRPH